MKFFDKLKAKYSENHDFEELKRTAMEGDKLTDFVSTGAFDILISLVLDPMEQAAFVEFTKVDPANTFEVIQIQKIYQVINEIKKRVDTKIQAGIMARQQLLDSTPEEG